MYNKGRDQQKKVEITYIQVIVSEDYGSQMKVYTKLCSSLS